MTAVSQKASSTIGISILIPVFNDAAGLGTTLQSLADVGVLERQDTEIIVCNDGGGEAVSRVAEAYDVSEVELESNLGSYAARNRGIENAKGDVLVFLDADQRVGAGWLEAGLAALNNADYVAGRIVVENGPEPSRWEIFDAMKAFPIEAYLGKQHFAPTANLFVHRRVFSATGLFDERLRSGGDYELGGRVYQADFKQIYAAEAITFHPARNWSQQAHKIKRVAHGYADIAFLIANKRPTLLLINELLVLCKVPFETFWRLLIYPFLSYKKSDLPDLLLILMEEKRKLFFHWNIAKRAFYWFYKC